MRQKDKCHRDREAGPQKLLAAAELAPQQPCQRERGEAHRQCHPFAEPVHPRARLGQAAPQGGDETDREEGQGEPQPQPAEDRQRRPCRQHQSRAERSTEQRPAARGGDEGRERAGPEAARRAALFSKRLPTAERRQFIISEQVERDCQRENQQREHADRMLELEGPADLLARRPER